VLFIVFQLDMFERIGVPLVENCLAGFNSSVFAYGQVGLYPFSIA
jgi:kinesin family protein 15